MPDREWLDIHHHPFTATQYVAGLDIGRVKDHSALVIVRKSRDDAGQAWCAVVFAWQWRLGISYPELAADVADIFHQLPCLPDPPALLVDATGIGQALLDILREVGLQPRGVTLTGGSDWSKFGLSIRLPKSIMAGELQAAFQTGHIAIAGDIPFRQQLIRELVEFRVSISAGGHETFEASAERVHDDMVTALGLAVFGSTRYFGVGPRLQFV